MKQVLVLTFLAFVTLAFSAEEICNEFCDGRDPTLVRNGTREAVADSINGRRIALKISDADNMAYATISSGQPGDEVWMDRSFDAGLTWDDGSLLGFTTIPAGAQSTSTLMFNIDNDSNHGLGALRACGRGLTPSDLICTEWARSTVYSGNPIDSSATALMQYYYGALWYTVGWWNGANDLTALIQYMQKTGRMWHSHVIESTFTNNLDGWDGNFTSDALDDTEWWALAWVDAYDLTGNRTYLDMAILDADYIYQYVDDVCGGGVWWSIYRTYKNAITNELYIQLAAALHNRIPGDTKYLNQAISLWHWFKNSGMINEENLINDGLRDDCTSNRDTTWTYNQGVILGALVELYKATGNQEYLGNATIIADAVMASPILNAEGILREPCERSGQVGCGDHKGGCDCNQISFKGIFMRHIGELNRNLPGRPYQAWIERQATSNRIWNRNALYQSGLYYSGPLIDINAGTQQSALEAFTAVI